MKTLTTLKTDEAQDVLNHLIKTNQSFCFLSDGRFITRGDCRKQLEIDTNKKDWE